MGDEMLNQTKIHNITSFLDKSHLLVPQSPSNQNQTVVTQNPLSPQSSNNIHNTFSQTQNFQNKKKHQRQDLENRHYRLPSLSKCLEHQILPKNSMLLRQMCELASTNRHFLKSHFNEFVKKGTNAKNDGIDQANKNQVKGTNFDIQSLFSENSEGLKRDLVSPKSTKNQQLKSDLNLMKSNRENNITNQKSQLNLTSSKISLLKPKQNPNLLQSFLKKGTGARNRKANNASEADGSNSPNGGNSKSINQVKIHLPIEQTYISSFRNANNGLNQNNSSKYLSQSKNCQQTTDQEFFGKKQDSYLPSNLESHIHSPINLVTQVTKGFNNQPSTYTQIHKAVDMNNVKQPLYSSIVSEKRQDIQIINLGRNENQKLNQEDTNTLESQQELDKSQIKAPKLGEEDVFEDESNNLSKSFLRSNFSSNQKQKTSLMRKKLASAHQNLRQPKIYSNRLNKTQQIDKNALGGFKQTRQRSRKLLNHRASERDLQDQDIASLQNQQAEANQSQELSQMNLILNKNLNDDITQFLGPENINTDFSVAGPGFDKSFGERNKSQQENMSPIKVKNYPFYKIRIKQNQDMTFTAKATQMQVPPGQSQYFQHETYRSTAFSPSNQTNRTKGAPQLEMSKSGLRNVDQNYYYDNQEFQVSGNQRRALKSAGRQRVYQTNESNTFNSRMTSLTARRANLNEKNKMESNASIRFRYNYKDRTDLRDSVPQKEDQNLETSNEFSPQFNINKQASILLSDQFYRSQLEQQVKQTVINSFFKNNKRYDLTQASDGAAKLLEGVNFIESSFDALQSHYQNRLSQPPKGQNAVGSQTNDQQFPQSLTQDSNAYAKRNTKGQIIQEVDTIQERATMEIPTASIIKDHLSPMQNEFAKSNSQIQMSLGSLDNSKTQLNQNLSLQASQKILKDKRSEVNSGKSASQKLLINLDLVNADKIKSVYQCEQDAIGMGKIQKFSQNSSPRRQTLNDLQKFKNELLEKHFLKNARPIIETDLSRVLQEADFSLKDKLLKEFLPSSTSHQRKRNNPLINVQSPINMPLQIKQPQSLLNDQGQLHVNKCILKMHQEYLLSKDPNITSPQDLKDLELLQQEQQLLDICLGKNPQKIKVDPLYVSQKINQLIKSEDINLSQRNTTIEQKDMNVQTSNKMTPAHKQFYIDYGLERFGSPLSINFKRRSSYEESNLISKPSMKPHQELKQNRLDDLSQPGRVVYLQNLNDQVNFAKVKNPKSNVSPQNGFYNKDQRDKGYLIHGFGSGLVKDMNESLDRTRHQQQKFMIQFPTVEDLAASQKLIDLTPGYAVQVPQQNLQFLREPSHSNNTQRIDENSYLNFASQNNFTSGYEMSKNITNLHHHLQNSEEIQDFQPSNRDSCESEAIQNLKKSNYLLNPLNPLHKDIQVRNHSHLDYKGMSSATQNIPTNNSFNNSKILSRETDNPQKLGTEKLDQRDLNQATKLAIPLKNQQKGNIVFANAPSLPRSKSQVKGNKGSNKDKERRSNLSRQLSRDQSQNSFMFSSRRASDQNKSAKLSQEDRKVNQIGDLFSLNKDLYQDMRHRAANHQMRSSYQKPDKKEYEFEIRGSRAQLNKTPLQLAQPMAMEAMSKFKQDSVLMGTQQNKEILRYLRQINRNRAGGSIAFSQGNENDPGINLRATELIQDQIEMGMMQTADLNGTFYTNSGIHQLHHLYQNQEFIENLDQTDEEISYMEMIRLNEHLIQAEMIPTDRDSGQIDLLAYQIKNKQSLTLGSVKQMTLKSDTTDEKKESFNQKENTIN